MTLAPLRLLYVVSRWGQPTETFVRREVEAAVAAGHDVRVLSLKRPLATALDVEVLHLGPVAAGVRAVTTAATRPVTVFGRLASTARRARPATLASHVAATVAGVAAAPVIGKVDFVHAHFAWVAATAADALARALGVPFGVMTHAFDVYDDRVVDDYLTDKLRRAAVVGAESDRIAADVASRFGVRPAVIRMGVPVDYLAPAPVVGVRAASRIVSVGSLLPKKGHETLLRAVASLADRSEPAELVVVGDGPERERLSELAGSLGVADRVTFTGAVDPDAVRELLDTATVFCLASRITGAGDRDGVPNVLIEAMARGVPVVATNVGGIPDLVRPGTGTIVEPDDPAALADALRMVLRDPPLRQATADNALAHIREHYTTEGNWLVLERLMRASLGPPGDG